MPDFQRDHERYFVIKTKGLSKMHAVKLREYLSRKGLTDHIVEECAVVEADWPIYDGVWALIERLATARGLPYMVDRDTLVDAFRAWLDDQAANPEEFFTLEEQSEQDPGQRAEESADQLIDYLTKGEAP